MSAHLILLTCAVIFWLWMLADCIINEPTGSYDKQMWFLTIVCLSIFGALTYYLVRRPRRIAALRR